MKRFVSGLLAFSMTLILSAGLFITWLFYTTGGLQFLTHLAPRIVPGKLHIADAKGKLGKTFTLTNISYQNKAVAIVIQSITIHWQLSELLNHKVYIKYLAIAGLRITPLLPAASNNQALHLPAWLPAQWIIEDLMLKNSAWHTYPFPDSHWHIDLSLAHETIAINNLSADLLQGHATLKGKITVAPYIIWQFGLQIQQFHPETLWPDFPGNISLQATSTGKKTDQHLFMQIDLPKAYGYLNQYPLLAYGRLNIIDHQYQLQNFWLHCGNNYAQANINLSDTWQGRWEISITDFNKLLPDSRGTLISTGTIAGTPQSPQVIGFIKAQQVLLAPLHIAVQKLNLQTRLAGIWDGDVQWQAQKVRYQQITIEKFAGTLQGTRAQHNLTLQLQQNKNRLRIRLQGKWLAPIWQAQLQQFDFTSPVIGSWQLRSTANLQLRKDILALQNFNWRSNTGYFNLQGQWHNNQSWWFKQQGKITIKPLNITLKNISLQARAEQQQVNYQGSFASSQGNLQLTGTANLHRPSPDLQLSLRGNNFLAVNTHEYQVWASPDLQLQKQSDRWKLSGELRIPKASIRLPDFRQKTVILSDDVVITDQPQKAPVAFIPENFYGDINLILGSHVNFQAEGLNARFAGQVRLTEMPDRPTTANGALLIKWGQYQTYGQTLQITDGRLLFNGNPITNPNLQIRASRQVTAINVSTPANANISMLPSTGTPSATPVITPSFNQSIQLTVGANVSGTLEDPQFALFSSPLALSQTDILSYLIFGHPADQISATDASVLLKVVSGMNMGGSQIEQLTREIQNIGGLDKVSIESTNYVNPSTSTVKQNTSLVLEKALSPRLYASYSVGLLESVNIFTLKYLINKSWSLQSTNSSFASGVDLFYNVERN